MAAVMFRGRSLRSRRLRGRTECGEENVTLDYSKAPLENIREILVNIVKQTNITKARKLGYYNAFVRLCHRSGTHVQYGISTEELLCCLRLGMFHEAKEMRAATMRAVRYMCKETDDVQAIIRLHIDFLVARSLDLCLDNEIERIHALRLIRKIMLVHPEKFPTSLLNVIISIANDGSKERDKMVRTCLATLCELAFLNPGLVVSSGACGTILRNVLDSYNLPRINESLLATVLYLLNHPVTRAHIKFNIELELLAPFTDCHYRFSPETADQSNKEDRENRYAASKMAIATVMRSWPGIMRLCKPDNSGLQSLLGVLFLPHMETRKEIMDILYDVFRIHVPEWTNDFSQALVSVDPSEMRDSWKLSEGFVAEEGKALLQHISKTRQDLVDNHLALILSSFICAGLLEALVEVIATSDIEVSIRGTILLGELLHLANRILPHECNQTSHCLPTLMALATNFQISANQRHLAKAAVTCLTRLHAVKKRGPVPCSIYLDQILQNSGIRSSEEQFQPLNLHREKLNECLPKESDHEIIVQAMSDSQVLKTKENFSWNWELIAAVLKWPDDNLRRIEDQSNIKFMRRLIYFFKPSSKLYSNTDLSQEDCRKYTIAGCHLVDFLVESAEAGQKYCDYWLGDIKTSLTEITTQRAPTNALFTPSHLTHSLSQDYFLLLGRFSATTLGDKILERTGIYQCLLDLMTITSHDTYVKLIVSSLDYSRDGLARIILSKGLTATSENARLYTASFMRVLLRSRVASLSSWGMELLVTQLYDQSRAVAMEALSVISEACEDEVNLLTLVKLRPSVLHLGYKGAVLLARFLSIPAGFKYFTDSSYVNHELEKWHQGFNQQYVSIVEERLNEALTTYEKTYDGSYTRRSSRRVPRKDVYVPVHLYGQLVQHKAGFVLLEKQEYLPEYFAVIRCQELRKEEQILKLKASLWAVGHIGTSVWGLGLLQYESIIPEMIKLAEECGVFSIRGTAFLVLGLIASTSKGADILLEYGWDSVRHKHSDTWPVIVDQYYTSDTELTFNVSSTSLASSAKSDNPLTGSGLLLSNWPERKETGYHSPSDQSPSPKAGFFIEDERSRSNTESSLPATFSSPGESPQKDSGVTFEPVDGSVEVEVHYGLRERSHSAGQSSSVPDEHEHLLLPSRTQSDPQQGSSPFTIEELPEIQLQNEDMSDDLQPDTQISHNIQSNTDQITSVERDCFKQRTVTYRDERSYSFSNSWTVKSRSNSVNTDATTSGVSSVESGPHLTTEHGHVGSLLSPIPSASSVLTDKSPTEVDSLLQGVHPSDTLRRLVNLKRVPSFKRRYSNPGLGHLSPLLKASDNTGGSVGENVGSFSTQRDVQGYATLRELQLQRQRTFSTDNEPALDVTNEESFMHKAKSLDYRLGNPRNGFHLKSGFASLPPKLNFSNLRLRNKLHCAVTCTRNQSYVSLQEMVHNNSSANLQHYDSLPRNVSKVSLRTVEKNPSSDRPEFIGICLPVDINMIFQIHEGEDQRSSLPQHSHASLSNRPSSASLTGRKLKVRSVSQTDEDGFEYHNTQTCLGCYTIWSEVAVAFDTGDTDIEDEAFVSKPVNAVTLTCSSTLNTPSVSLGPSPSADIIKKGFRSRDSSISEMLPIIPSSGTSNISLESTMRNLMCENTELGRSLVRKECLRLIINLASSVGMKSSEQGLLSLKQKFPKSFQDVCLYSEVCYLLSQYNFRVTARRFIQELFQDLSFSQHFKEAHEILGIPLELPGDEMEKEHHEILDKVEETIKTDESVT